MRRSGSGNPAVYSRPLILSSSIEGEARVVLRFRPEIAPIKAAVLRLVDAMSPCVVMVDEVEKALAGSSGPSGDSGVSARLSNVGCARRPGARSRCCSRTRTAT